MKTYGRLPKRPSAGNVEDIQPSKAMLCEAPEPKRRVKLTDFFSKKIDESDCLASSPRRTLLDGSRDKKDLGKQCPSQGRKVQAFLDFGQKELSATICPSCGLVFDRSFSQDIKRHEREHERFFDCFSAKHYYEVADWQQIYRNGDHTLVFRAGHLVSKLEALSHRVNTIMDAVEQDWQALKLLSFYLYCRNEQVIGLLSVEDVSDGIAVSADGSHAKRHVAAGVCRIWVKQEYRRAGIAMALLNTIRKCNHQSSVQCSHDCRIPANMIAFSQPTESGRALALKYLDDKNATYIAYCDPISQVSWDHKDY